MENALSKDIDAIIKSVSANKYMESEIENTVKIL